MFAKTHLNVAVFSAALAMATFAGLSFSHADEMKDKEMMGKEEMKDKEMKDKEMMAEKPAHYTVSLGIKGYSPVSYFTKGMAEPGSPEHAATHDDVTYFFTSPEQVELFEQNPEKYLPAYGGWCAFGAAVQNHFPVDPEAFKIVDGRLMLFLQNEQTDALELWNQKSERKLVREADDFWQRTHGG